jgi:D-alanyl-D-alanine carboxypeptidase
MIANWMGVQVGSRVQITNLPTQVIADTVDVFVEGITQTVTPLTWTATMMTTPASPFNIFTLADASLGRLDSDTSTLATAIGTADTSLSVAVAVDDFGATVLWTTDATECPFDIDLDGERVTVTAISGGSSPQTFTVTRSVNGVSKTHTAGTAVTVWHPGVLAL